MHIVFLDRDTLAPEVRLRPPAFPHTWQDHPRCEAAEVAALAADADVVITNKVPIRADALDRLNRLKLVAVAATGVDRIDVPACRARGVAVANIRGYAVHTVPEHTFAMILALRRNLMGYRDAVRRGRWQEAELFCFFDYPILDLHGARLGIIGAGAIGRRVAAIGQAFGMIPRFAARKGADQVEAGRLPWTEVLATSDILSLHCPLTDETRGLIGMAEFEAMERRPLLINTARGGIVDEEALVAALDRGLIAGAGLDVSRDEPPRPDSPLHAIVHRPDVIVTPHVAWASRDAMQTLADQLIDVIEAFAAGRPINLV
ncbi:MAG: D-2-hydroxyacid dehydrogenase [Rhodospirillales bacterium]|nr:MAG: D-2-hydroxyacid dehydrogenase [Rhodospirillales bacterium]